MRENLKRVGCGVVSRNALSYREGEVNRVGWGPILRYNGDTDLLVWSSGASQKVWSVIPIRGPNVYRDD
jgi:hypothetical protein